MEATKDSLHLVVIGHEGCGKSTIIGNLMYQRGGIDPLVLQQYELEAMDLGSAPSAKYAWVMKKLTDDRRNRPLSFEPLSSRSLKLASANPRQNEPDDTTLWRIETDSRLVSIIDAPGHPAFLQNMITGASQAHAALLVVSALDDEFAVGFSTLGQAREHLILAHHLGIRELVVAINKLDKCQWSSEIYDSKVAETRSILSEIGFDASSTRFIPVSGTFGENLVLHSLKLNWYSGWTRRNGQLGISLLDAIDDISLNTGPSKDGPFRLAIQDGFQISEMGVIVVGKVESGSLVKGMEIVLIPSKARGKVSLIERRQEVVASAGPGDQIGFQIEGLTLKQVRRGYICCDAARHPLPPVTKFLAQLAVLSGASSLGHIKKGDKVRLDCHNTHMDVTFDSIDSGTKSLVPGDVACVTLVADEPIALDLFASCPPLGRFALRVKSHTVAVGLVTGLKPNTR